MTDDNDTAHRVAILVLPEFSHLTLSAVIEPMRVANKVTRRSLYEWNLLGTDDLTVRASNGISIRAAQNIANARRFDTLLVVASFNVLSHTTQPVIRFIREASRRGAMICGFETGAYALAVSGVLDGYRATVHWEDLDDFQERFPRIEVVQDRFILDRKRGTTGGALPALDFMLDLIGRQHGLALGLTVSGVFLYDQDRPASQFQRAISTARLAYRDPKLADAIGLMEAEIGDCPSVPEIATRVGLSARALQRRFQRHLGVSPARFFNEMQLSLAYRLLEHTDRSVTDVALSCGYGSASAFARAFRSRYQRSPTSLRSKREQAPMH